MNCFKFLYTFTTAIILLNYSCASIITEDGKTTVKIGENGQGHSHSHGNGNGHDSLCNESDLEAGEAQNLKIIKDFVHIVTKEKDLDKAAAKYIDPNYIEHNPDGQSGIEGFKNLWKLLTAPAAVTEVKRIAADCNLVFTHGKGFWDGKYYAFVDIYRLSHGRIVEHWDVVQEILANSPNLLPMV